MFLSDSTNQKLAEGENRMKWKCSKCQTENKDTYICSVIRNVEYPEKLRKSLMLDEKKIFEILKEK